MQSKNWILGILFIGCSMTTLGVLLPTGNVAFALTIYCNFGDCAGTNGADAMGGTQERNFITGCGGNDVISGSGGNDALIGDEDGVCPPNMIRGADRISGGPGDDSLWHSTDEDALPSDGHKDFLDCGPGNDRATINVSVDHDVAVNCETVLVG